MKHKEAIQAMLDGETLHHKDNINLHMYYDAVCEQFITSSDDAFTYQEDINHIDFSEWEGNPWRAKKYDEYWFVDYDAELAQRIEEAYSVDNELYEMGNYFKTEDEAKEAAQALRAFWKEYRGE